ncbi:MAG: peroxiredoxin family protein [Bacteroidia bacterium]|nr:peroxiredoxin family protein [Bacteroidia bacterium]
MKSLHLGLLLGLLLGTMLPAFAQLSVPSFSFTDLSGATYNSAKLNQSKSALIIYFDPWCEHCNQQAEWIAARPDAFKNVQILFVTFEPEKTPIQEFKNKYFSAAGWSNVVFLQDLDFQFETYFGYTDDPLYIYCYKPGGGKGKYFGEEQRAEVLINFL